MAFVCVQFHVTAFKLSIAAYSFFQLVLKHSLNFRHSYIVVLSSEKLHILNSLRKKNKSFR